MNSSATVETTLGKVRGFEHDGIAYYLGIPYGADTGGANRFLPPRERQPWEGVLEATVYGPDAPQGDGSVPGEGKPETNNLAIEQSEDCLVLNAWTPAADDAKRPVLFWIHGGGFYSGSGSGTNYDGANLSRRGDVVVVSINHRLGSFGYLHLADVDPAAKDAVNVGMLDIVLALQWAKANVAAFGGDPDNITVFGESGGGRKISALMGMPSANGLFHRAIVESGPGVFMNSRAACERLARAMLEELGITSEPLKSLQALPAATVLAAQAAVMRKLNRNAEGFLQVFAAMTDGEIIPQHPFDPEAPAWGADIPVIIGYNHTEATFMLGHDPDLLELDEAGLEARIRKLRGDHAPDLIAAYRARYPEATCPDLLAYIATGNLRYPYDTLRQAEAIARRGRGPAYLYTLTWRTPASRGALRTPHTLEIPLVFDNVETCRGILGRGDEPLRMRDQMCDAWLAFARTGNPDHEGIPHWPAYELEQRPTMVFNLESRIAPDFGGIEREAWQPIFGR